MFFIIEIVEYLQNRLSLKEANMQRTKLIDRILPAYTKGEEIFNMTSHIVRRSTWNCYDCFMRCNGSKP